MTAFDEYTDMYGCHFNKKLYEYAVSMMRDRNGEKVEVLTRDQVKEKLQNYGVELENDRGYDAAYVYAMKRSDDFESSIPDERHLAFGVKDFLDDRDGYPTKAFDHFVVDCRAKEEPIFWEDFL